MKRCLMSQEATVRTRKESLSTIYPYNVMGKDMALELMPNLNDCSMTNMAYLLDLFCTLYFLKYFLNFLINLHFGNQPEFS